MWLLVTNSGAPVITILVYLLLTRPLDQSRLKVSKNFSVIVSYQYGQNPKEAGEIWVSIGGGSTTRSKRITPPKDAWLERDIADRPAVLLSKIPGKAEANLDITYSVESGVYGYHRVMSYLVDARLKNLLVPLGDFFYFSDFGGWRRVRSNLIEYWDADLSEDAAHEGPHHYIFRRERQTLHKGKVILSRRTKHVYNIGWDWNSGNRPRQIAMKNDPLTEFHSRWTWWGSAQRGLPLKGSR